VIQCLIVIRRSRQAGSRPRGFAPNARVQPNSRFSA